MKKEAIASKEQDPDLSHFAYKILKYNHNHVYFYGVFK